MHLVGDQSDANLRANQALNRLKFSLRRLTANLLMRIARGAGASAELGAQMAACIEAMADYQDAAGYEVDSEDLDQMVIPEVAQFEYRPWVGKDAVAQARWEEDGTIECEIADLEVRRACLQIAASMLVNQLSQQRRGEADFHKAIRRRDAAWERRRSYHQSSISPAPRAKRKTKREPVL